MGLIKTGLVLAGGYGLIKAASRAANEHQDKKDKRHSQNQSQSYSSQQYSTGQNQQTGYNYPNHKNNAYPQSQSRTGEPWMKHGESVPPPYYQQGSAQDYYSGKVN